MRIVSSLFLPLSLKSFINRSTEKFFFSPSRTRTPVFFSNESKGGQSLGRMEQRVNPDRGTALDMRSLTSLPGQNSGSISISGSRNERGLNSAQSDNVSAACSRAFRLYATQCRCPSTLGSDGWLHLRVLRPRNFETKADSNARDHHQMIPRRVRGSIDAVKITLRPVIVSF